MSVLFVVLPIALVLAAMGIAGFVWAIRKGQYDDLDTPPYRAMFDDDAVDAEADSRSNP